MRQNNFDLIRLLAAMQVLIYHCLTHIPYLQNKFPVFRSIISNFPGVPIFFTISGFLIFRSFYNNPNLKNYFKNRFLRIYPALWFCFMVTVILLIISGQINLNSFKGFDIYKWAISQLTFFQFYKINDFLNWGIGHPNGSLWTIFVEIQFYVIVPFLGTLILKNKGNLLLQNVIIIFIGLASFLIIKYTDLSIIKNTDYQKLFRLTIPNFLYFFSFGIFIFINWDKLRPFLENKAILWFFAYCIYVYLFHYLNKKFETVYEPNIYAFIGNFLLSFFTISFAYSKPFVGNILLNGIDISYGLYIYHMPLVNFALYFSLINSYLDFSLLFLSIIGLSIFSWIFIESKALNHKKPAHER